MIKIRTEKFLKGCRQMRRVLSIEGAMTDDELPPEYLKGDPRMWYNKEWKTLRLDKTGIPDLVIGKEYREEDFQDAIEFVREAAKRLRNINEERREILEKWCGEETILI